VANPSSIIERLEQVIAERRRTPPTDRKSYVASLLEGGVPAIGSKVTEEAAETVEAADEPGPEGRAHLVREVADLMFHTLVLLAHREVTFEEVEAELARRFGIGGFEEKAARPPRPDA
jgi:phosphoribosyl-ATP pyrophosphohydrolase